MLKTYCFSLNLSRPETSWAKYYNKRYKYTLLISKTFHYLSKKILQVCLKAVIKKVSSQSWRKNDFEMSDRSGVFFLREGEREFEQMHSQ